MSVPVWQQVSLSIAAKKRGFHLITDEIEQALPDLNKVKVGLLHLFIQHTSASLTINENADYTVRQDLEAHFSHFVPENQPYYQHTYEGVDDIPAHIKSSTIGCQLSIPIANGQLQLGGWQGIYLCEHRSHAASRHIIATIQGQSQSTAISQCTML